MILDPTSASIGTAVGIAVGLFVGIRATARAKLSRRVEQLAAIRAKRIMYGTSFAPGACRCCGHRGSCECA